MKERLKRKQLGSLKGLLVIAGLVAALVAIAAILFVIADYFQITFMQYIEYALFILIGILLVRKWLTEYEYILIDDELYVDRYLGKRPRRLLETKLNHIVYIGADKPRDYTGRPQRLTYLPRRKGVTYIVYIDSDNKKCAFFSPGSELLSLIESRMKNK